MGHGHTQIVVQLCYYLRSIGKIKCSKYNHFVQTKSHLGFSLLSLQQTFIKLWLWARHCTRHRFNPQNSVKWQRLPDWEVLIDISRGQRGGPKEWVLGKVLRRQKTIWNSWPSCMQVRTETGQCQDGQAGVRPWRVLHSRLTSQGFPIKELEHHWRP